MHHALVKAHEEETDSDSEKEEEKESEKESEKEEESEKESEKEEESEEETAKEKEADEAKEEEKKAEEAKAVEDLKETASDMVAVPPSYAAFYGPGCCVTTYKGPSGSCIMETSCEGEDMSGFTYGLMCVDGKGERVRHVFMGDAFEPVETFDTLITCDLCLGLDAAGSVGLGQEVGALKDEVKALSEKVEKLEKDAAPAAAADAEAADAAPAAAADAEAADADAAADASMLIHKSKKMSTTKVKNVEDPTPPPAAPAKVEVDVIHHNHETKFLKSKNRVTLNSHSG